MKIKRTAALIMSFVMVLCLTACGDKNQNQTQTQTEISSQEQTATPAEPASTQDEADDIYDLTRYESPDVFNIKKLDLGEELEEKCTSYKFTYLSDGYKIKGYISIPMSAVKSQTKCKCILFNRGGNKNIGYLERDTAATLCASFNRIVIASQYRGAEGCEGKDEFGGDDLHDVIKLIDLCENQFSFVDMTDFCAAGISRGGVMTYPAARQDSRIKRIIAVAAVSDLFNAYEERDDMKPVLKEAIGFTPEENPSEYEKRSAVYWADEIKVPVLIIHSKYDKQVSYKQSEELYSKLKDTTDCTFITHDDDVHNIHPEDIKTIIEWLNDDKTSSNS